MTRKHVRASVISYILLALASRSVLAIPGLAQQHHLAVEEPVNSPTQLYKPLHADHELDQPNTPAFCKLPNRTPFLGEGFPTNPYASYVPSTGILKAAMIFVDFPDAPSSETTSSLHDFFIPAASNWYSNASCGKLTLQVTPDLSRFHRMPRNSTEYTYNRGMTYKDHVLYIQDALDTVGHSLNFTNTNILYIVPTIQAPAISYSPTFMVPIRAADGWQINKTVTFGQDIYFHGPKILNHETGHTMGLPDLYSYRPHTRAAIFVGGYDLMADIEGVSPDYLGWHKWRLGWLDDGQVACIKGAIAEIDTEAVAKVGSETEIVIGNMKRNKSHRYTITPIEEPFGLKAVIIPYNDTFAIVTEYRSGKGLNNDVCGRGILIYTVSTLIPTGQGPVRVQNSRPHITRCAGELLNDVLFVPWEEERRSFVAWNVNITVIEEVDEGFVVEVAKSVH